MLLKLNLFNFCSNGMSNPNFALLRSHINSSKIVITFSKKEDLHPTVPTIIFANIT